ncbi:hypothetical protein [Thermoactinomyces mirandus]|uniref:Uncharacterized protein n=1 Tax=Thermoactinomyces mirandus TaxID=2756294 RepID=A0A7W2ASH3_9BACL|nr:hypothetical protein [Thermoactinomyces mirandus]MBA4603623.1 hypothetical protein [Thermoactinomyces mirandus]
MLPCLFYVPFPILKANRPVQGRKQVEGNPATVAFSKFESFWCGYAGESLEHGQFAKTPGHVGDYFTPIPF